MSEGRLHQRLGGRVGQEVLQRNANRGALHLRVGIIQPGQHLLLQIRLPHQALERRGRVQDLRVVRGPRLFFEQGTQAT